MIEPRDIEEKLKDLVSELRLRAEDFDDPIVINGSFGDGIEEAAGEIEEFISTEIISKHGG